jgi:DNA-binding NarL/FixJ family response regulator
MREHVKKTRIFLADDNPAILDKLVEMLEGAFEIEGTASDGRTAQNAVDISMPILNGIDAASNLIRMHTRTKIIFLTVHDDQDFVKAALATGVAGYIVKSHMATDLFPAIREALAGHRFISPCIHARDSVAN